MEQSANCAPICGVRGKALTGSVLTLDAIGPQDTYLLSNDSNFLPSFDRSAPNATFQRQTRVGNPTTQYFGNTIKQYFKPREMGDLLSNMYLKTKIPALLSNDDPDETISIPSSICQNINVGESFTVVESEIEKIKIGSTKLLKYNPTIPKNYNFDLTINDGSNVLTDVASGFFELNGATLGTRIFNKELFTSVDPNTNFKVSANISTYNVVSSNTLTIDGGLKLFDVFGINKDSKNDRWFGAGTDTDVLYTADNLPFMTINDVDLNINFQMKYKQVVSGTNYVETDTENFPPQVIFISPTFGEKFVFSNVTALEIDSSLRFDANTTLNNYTTVDTQGTGYTTGTASLGQGAGLDILDVGTGGEIGNVVITNHGYGYKEGDILTVTQGSETSGEIVYRLGDRNKELDAHDTLNHISVDGNQFQPPLENESTVATVGDDFSVVYYPQGQWSNSVGAGNVAANRSGMTTKRVTIRDSQDFVSIRPAVQRGPSSPWNNPYVFNLPCWGRKLLYRADFSTGFDTNFQPNVTITMNEYDDGGGNIDYEQTWYANASTFSIYSNASAVTNSTQSFFSAFGGVKYTTPPGARFLRWSIGRIPSDSRLWRLDGSLNPIVSVTTPSKNIKLVWGAAQVGANQFVNAFFTGTKADEGKSFYINADSRVVTNYAYGGTGDPNDDGILDGWIGKTQLGLSADGSDRLSEESSIFMGIVARTVSRITILSNLDGTNTGDAFSIANDPELLYCLQYGGLEIEFFDSRVEDCSVAISYPKLDFYKGTDLLTAYNLPYNSNVTTVDYEVTNNTVVVTNNTQSVTITDFTESEHNLMTFGSGTHRLPFTKMLLYEPLMTGQLVFKYVASNFSNNINRIQLFQQPTTYEETFVTEFSNGYVNVVSGTTTTGPLPIQNEQFDIQFLANSYDTPCTISNEYDSFEVGVSDQAINDFVDPYKNGVELNYDGNIFTYVTNNYVDYYLDGSNVFPLQESQFFENGCKINFDGLHNNFGTIIGNVITVNSRTNVLSTNSFSVYENPSDDYSSVQVYTGKPYFTSSSALESDAPNVYPVSMTSLTFSTANKTDISYNQELLDTNNRISLLPPDSLTDSVGTLNAWFTSNISIYSGPTKATINGSSLNLLFGNQNYSTNVIYTRGKYEMFLNDSEILSTNFETYKTNSNVDFTTYSNTISLRSNTYNILDANGVEYDKFLRSNTYNYNADNDFLGQFSGTNDSEELSASDTAHFGHNGFIFVVGGNSRSTCYRASSNLSLGEPTFQELREFPFAFNGGAATIDTVNEFVYLFSPNNNADLYRIKYDSTSNIFSGDWELESTAFPYSAVTCLGQGLTYSNGRLYSMTGHISSYGTINSFNSIIYYDLSIRQWVTVSASYGMSRVSAPQVASGNLVYFGGRKTTGASVGSTTVDTYYVCDTTTNTITECGYASGLGSIQLDYSTLGVYTPGAAERVFIIDPEDIPAGVVRFIDRADSFKINSTPATGKSLLGQLDGILVGPDFQNGALTLYGGYKTGVGRTSNIYGFSCGSATFTDPSFNMEYSLAALDAGNFVGTSYPGNIPVVRSGIRITNKKVPLISIKDNTTSNVVSIGINRTAVSTSLRNSTRENKGYFNTWYADELDANGDIFAEGWDGKDSGNNFTQTQTLGSTWPADAQNDVDAVANVYSSNIEFTSTRDIDDPFDPVYYSNLLFETGNVTTGSVDNRGGLVPNQIGSTNVEYDNFTFTANNFFNYTVDGISRYDNAFSSSVTFTSPFNEFRKDNFENYPSLEVCYSTDNIPRNIWNFTEDVANDNYGAIIPPWDTPVSNLVIKEVYKQYQSSRIYNRTGKLNEVTFNYGTSRIAEPTGSIQNAATLQQGIYRGDVANVTMAVRKQTLCAFSREGDEDSPASQIEIFKIFSNGEEPDSNTVTRVRGWYDQIIVSFGPATTSDGTRQSITMMPGLNSNSAVTPGGSTDILDATNPDDDVIVTFQDYTASDLSVNVTITYENTTSSKILKESKIISLSPDYYNLLSDADGLGGNYVIKTTYNNGVISNVYDEGVRPTTVSYPGKFFSSNLLATSLSAFSFIEYTPSSTNNVFQENVYESVFPVNIGITRNKYNGIYCNNIGRSLIKEARFIMDGQLIERLDDLWYVTRDELFRTVEEKDSLKFLINGGQDYLPTSQYKSSSLDLYIPMDFFFCRSRKTSSTELVPKKVYDENRSLRPYLPLCALGDREFSVEIDFHPQTFFSNTGLSIDLSYLDTAIITEECIVSKEERLWFKSKPQEIIVETVEKLPEQELSLLTPTLQQRFNGFISSNPVKMVTWLFRSKQFENETDSTEFLHRYNFSTVRSENDRYKLFFQFMKDCSIFVEGLPVVERLGTNDFFRYLQAIQGGLTSTERNIYSYLFSLYPSKSLPSGSTNFSETNSNKTFLTFKLSPEEQSSAIEQINLNLGATIHAHSYGYNILKIENGFISQIFS